MSLPSWRDSLARTFLVVLLITVATGKVFSTQYIFWPLWLAAYGEGLRLRWLVLALLTLFIAYSYTLGMLSPSLLEAIWIRNALLVAVTLGYLLGPGDERAPSDTRHLTWRTLRQRLL
ncbi:MAG: hypothetical protein NVSMB65_03520 [Chloroflexota bacterium]